MRRCRFTLRLNRQRCGTYRFWALDIKLGRKVVPGGCHRAGRALQRAQRALGKLFGCTP